MRCRVREMRKKGGEVRKFGSRGRKRWSCKILFPPLFPTLNWKYEERCGTGKEGKFGPQIYFL